MCVQGDGKRDELFFLRVWNSLPGLLKSLRAFVVHHKGRPGIFTASQGSLDCSAGPL